MSKEEAIKKLLEGTVVDEKISNAEGDFSTGENEDYHKIARTAGNWEVPDNADLSESWESISNRIRPTKSRTLIAWSRVAASIILLAVVGYFIFAEREKTSVNTSFGEIVSVDLPDGSEAILNAQTTAEFHEHWGEERKVWLEGKARFNVNPGSRFQVVTDDFTTSVLGTSFDVDFDGNRLIVSCYSGEVAVASYNDIINLLPGEQAYVDRKSVSKSEFDASLTAKWIEGEFYFDNVPLNEVVDELRHQFGVEISGKYDGNRRYKGYFYQDDMGEALDLVFKPMGYDYSVSREVITIR